MKPSGGWKTEMQRKLPKSLFRAVSEPEWSQEAEHPFASPPNAQIQRGVDDQMAFSSSVAALPFSTFPSS